jgi:hypothetical protein
VPSEAATSLTSCRYGSTGSAGGATVAVMRLLAWSCDDCVRRRCVGDDHVSLLRNA